MRCESFMGFFWCFPELFGDSGLKADDWIKSEFFFKIRKKKL